MADVHRRIVAAGHFKGLSIAEFAEQAGRNIGDVNYVHPFREGNGRTQLLFLQQLAAKAGHRLDLRHIDGKPWIEASKRANDADYGLMVTAIRKGLENSRGQG
jgi:cell filamentation protein